MKAFNIAFEVLHYFVTGESISQSSQNFKLRLYHYYGWV